MTSLYLEMLLQEAFSNTQNDGNGQTLCFKRQDEGVNYKSDPMREKKNHKFKVLNCVNIRNACHAYWKMISDHLQHKQNHS